jgi:hypothetical protein
MAPKRPRVGAIYRRCHPLSIAKHGEQFLVVAKVERKMFVSGNHWIHFHNGTKITISELNDSRFYELIGHYSENMVKLLYGPDKEDL